MKFLVRSIDEGGSFEERHGDLALGGASFNRYTPAPGRLYEMRFQVPGLNKDIRATAELLRVSNEARGIGGYHLRFKALDTASELAIAKYMDDLAGKRAA
jgi:hypothetical protein